MTASTDSNEEHTNARLRVLAAYNRQLQRAGKPNAELASGEIETYCMIDRASEQLIQAAMDKLGLSARAYHRILRLSRTIADLEDCDAITTKHVSEAIAYRSLDRFNH